MSNLYDISDIKKIFKDKNVIIVGPANNLIGENKGKFIDSFDIVCRLNDSYIISKERQKDYGKRCDILFNTCNCELLCIINRYQKYLKNCKVIINPTSKIHKQDYKNTKKTVYENYLDINLGLNTGMCTLDFILNGLNIKSLYICGFSFHGIKEKKYIKNDIVNSYETYLFNSKIVYNCNCNKNKPCKKRIDPRYGKLSNEYNQLNFFKNEILKNSKVKIDKTIDKLL